MTKRLDGEVISREYPVAGGLPALGRAGAGCARTGIPAARVPHPGGPHGQVVGRGARRHRGAGRRSGNAASASTPDELLAKIRARLHEGFDVKLPRSLFRPVDFPAAVRQDVIVEDRQRRPRRPDARPGHDAGGGVVRGRRAHTASARRRVARGDRRRVRGCRTRARVRLRPPGARARRARSAVRRAGVLVRRAMPARAAAARLWPRTAGACALLGVRARRRSLAARASSTARASGCSWTAIRATRAAISTSTCAGPTSAERYAARGVEGVDDGGGARALRRRVPVQQRSSSASGSSDPRPPASSGSSSSGTRSRRARASRRPTPPRAGWRRS